MKISNYTARRVVVTGIGLVTPLGTGALSTWRRVISGKSGIVKINSFDVEDLPCQVGGMIPLVHKGEDKPALSYEDSIDDDLIPFDIDSVVSTVEQRRMDKFIAYALAAAKEAIEDSGWKPETEEEKCRTGVIVGSGIGGLNTIYDGSLTLKESGPRRISPFFIPASLINLAPGHISIRYGFKGPNQSVVTACATSAHALGDAARMISCGEADVMVAGGAEASIGRIGIAGFCAARALSTNFNDNPTAASRPWDKARDGFVMGEGAGILILEELEHAERRGAKIYAELVGYGSSGDAYHLTAPREDGDGAYRAMTLALEDAGLQPRDIGYINAHGTSTPMGDLVEIKAMKRVFGDNLPEIPISSTKSAMGHLLGAAGSVEAILSILALNNAVLPPTLNLHNPEEETEGLNLVPFKAQDKEIDCVLSNSFGFGGTNASLVFVKV